VLPGAARMRRGTEFTTAVRRGARSGGSMLVVHAAREPVAAEPGSAEPVALAPVRVGFIVGRSVGSAVVRNTVRRRLRHLLRERLDRLAPGTRLVVRANPPAASASSPVLAAELDRVLTAVLGRIPDPAKSASGVGVAR